MASKKKVINQEDFADNKTETNPKGAKLWQCLDKELYDVALTVRNQPQKLTKFSSDKKRKSPYNTIAATNCEGNPPLEIDKVKEK